MNQSRLQLYQDGLCSSYTQELLWFAPTNSFDQTIGVLGIEKAIATKGILPNKVCQVLLPKMKSSLYYE